MNALRARMIEDLQLHGLSKSTQALYVQAVRHLAEYYRKPPDQIREEELRQYFLLILVQGQLSENELFYSYFGWLYRIKRSCVAQAVLVIRLTQF
jgi:hypothetical protein